MSAAPHEWTPTDRKRLLVAVGIDVACMAIGIGAFLLTNEPMWLVAPVVVGSLAPAWVFVMRAMRNARGSPSASIVEDSRGRR